MNLDVKTLFLVTMHVEIMLGLLLFFAWSQNFGKRALAWWGSAHILRAVSIMLLGMHGSIPDWASIELGNAALFGSFALTWSGVRVFDQRSPEPIWCLFGAAVWLLAGQTTEIAKVPEAQVLLGSGIVTAYMWLAAYEFWRGRAEALVSRWPVIFMLFAHGALFLLRTPLGQFLDLAPGNDLAMSAWLDILSLEALLFTISIAFLLLAVAKERTEYRHRAAAQTDPLTGIANRRGFIEQVAALKRAALDPRPSAVVLFDLDHFKSVNDRFGHAVGDRALQVFADIAKHAIGNAGLVGRWGGDEFTAVIRETAPGGAEALAEHIRASFEQAATELDGRPAHTTVSAGLVFASAGPIDLPGLMLLADQTLYRAKERGRNRIQTAGPAPAQTTEPADAVVTSLDARRHKAASAA